MMMMREIRYGKRPYTNTWLTKNTLTTAVPKLFLFFVLFELCRLLPVKIYYKMNGYLEPRFRARINKATVTTMTAIFKMKRMIMMC